MTSTAMKVVNEWGSVLPFPGYQMPAAQLWELHGSEWVEYAHTSPDVYDLLTIYALDAADPDTSVTPDAFALMTTGYAAPLTPGEEATHAPSEHPDRLRVAICVVYSVDGSTASALRFAEGREPLNTEGGGESGGLADALDGCALAHWGWEWVARFASTFPAELDNSRARQLLSMRRSLTDTHEGDNEQ